MRVLIASDSIGELVSGSVGEILARGWLATGAQVAVVPMAVGGQELVNAVEQLGGTGEIVDLTEGDIQDSIPEGALGVVTEDQLSLPLTGIGGVAAGRGRAEGWDLPAVIAEESRLAEWASEIWPDNPDASLLAGSGAHGGQGLRVLAAGGELITGHGLCARISGLADTARQADLIVSGCTILDFGSFGGPVVREVVRTAQEACRPVVLVVGHNHISARELRSAGIEVVYAVQRTDQAEPVRAEDLAVMAERVARAWSL